MATDRTQGLFTKYQFFSLYLPSILLSLGTSMVAPVLPNFAKSFDVGFTDASMVFVVAQIGALVATFPAGYLMDTIGRRPVLMAGPLLTAVSSFMTPFAGSFGELLFWRFVGGAATQLWMQARLVVIADTAAHEHRGRQIAWMNGTARAGQLFGPSIGGFLAVAFGYTIPFVAHAAVTLAATLPSVMLIKETAPVRGAAAAGGRGAAAQGSWGDILKVVFTFQMLVFLTVQFSANLSRGGNESGALNLYAVYAYNLGPEQLGLLNSVAAFSGLPVPIITGWLMDRFGRRSVIVPGFAFYASSSVLMALSAFNHLPFELFALGFVLVQFSQGTVGGTMQVLGTDMAPGFARGRFFAIWRMVAQLAATITPAIFALLSEHLGYGSGFMYLAVCAYLVAFLVGWVLKDTRKMAEEREAAAKAANAG